MNQTTPVTDNGVVQTYAATPYPSTENWELLPAWGTSDLPYHSGDNLSKWLAGSNSAFTKAEYLFGIASNLHDNPEDIALQISEAFYNSDPETYTNPIFEIAGFTDTSVDLSSMSLSQQAAFMQDRFERASGNAYSAGQSYLGVERTVQDLIVGLESSMSGRFEEKFLYDKGFNNLSQVGQIRVGEGAAFNQAIEGFQGLLSIGGAILNDTGGPNGLTNRAINTVADGWEMADFIRQDPRLVDAVVRYGKQYVPSMPLAEQSGAAIGLVSTFGAGAALKGMQAIKASENLSGLFDKFSDAVSRAQMPIGLELQAGRLYSGIPLDAVKWKGFGQNKVDSGVPTYDTPYKPLTKAQRADLQAKLDSRAINRDEYQRLDWDRRFANRRATGVRQFWAEERARLRAGEAGTRNWNPEQREAILSGKRPQFSSETIQGHHKYNALDHPQIANDPKNIYPATRSEHFERWHGGNWRNDSFGEPVNPSYLEEF